MMNIARDQIFSALFNLVSAPLRITGTTYEGSTLIDTMDSVVGLYVGQPFTGTYVAAGAQIASIDYDNKSIHLTKKSSEGLSSDMFTINLYNYASRRVQMFDQIPQDRRPALIQVEDGESYAQDFTGKPPRVTLRVKLIIYTWAKGLQVPGITLLNPRIDAIERALAPPPLTFKQTLGGLVDHAWIEGEIIKVSGDLDGDGVAVVPINILVPA
jgi:hypothetical protein